MTNGFEALVGSTSWATQVDAAVSTTVEFRPLPDRPVVAPDAWLILQTLRAEDRESAKSVGLSHIVTASGYGSGVGYGSGSATARASATAPGSGTASGRRVRLRGRRRRCRDAWRRPLPRCPVVWAAPARAQADPRATAVRSWHCSTPASAQHPWFARRHQGRRGGRPAHRAAASPRPTTPRTGCTIDRVNGMLDRLAGHGTFIAGVVRQHCPEATLMAVPVMYGDGVADEANIVEALQLLYARQLLAHCASRRKYGPRVDVLSLSLGYYHETPGTFDDEAAFVSVLRGLASTGVAVVAAAGNGASDVEFFPAAFARGSSFDVPLVSVGAHNPGGSTHGPPSRSTRTPVLGHGLPVRHRGHQHDADHLQRQHPQRPATCRARPNPARGSSTSTTTRAGSACGAARRSRRPPLPATSPPAWSRCELARGRRPEGARARGSSAKGRGRRQLAGGRAVSSA